MASVIAVIHHADHDTSLANARIAFEAGCRGVALIQMDGFDDEVDAPALAVKAAHPSLLVGANRLSSAASDAILADLALGLDFSWSDESGVSSGGIDPEALRVRDALAEARRGGRAHLFFGAVAFKSQAPEPDPVGAARVASVEPWIATTSGPRTGHPPEEAKLAAMCGVLGRERLAVASGIGPDNADVLARHVGWVLAATAISRDFHRLDPALTRALVERCGAAG